MISIAAAESGLNKSFISELNENAPDVLYDLYWSTDAVKHALIAQEQIIRKIADNGTCVIVGRAADHILKDYDNVINIFIHAPFEHRVKNIMEMYNDDYETAKNYVKKSDYKRAAYYRNISGKKWDDPKNYHLCIDSSNGIDLAVEQICNLYNQVNK